MLQPAQQNDSCCSMTRFFEVTINAGCFVFLNTAFIKRNVTLLHVGGTSFSSDSMCFMYPFLECVQVVVYQSRCFGLCCNHFLPQKRGLWVFFK